MLIEFFFTFYGPISHYENTDVFTDHVFAMCTLLGYQFSSRCRNLSSLRLHRMEDITILKTMKKLFAAKANIQRIESQWPDIICLIASLMTHKVIPSEIIR